MRRTATLTIAVLVIAAAVALTQGGAPRTALASAGSPALLQVVQNGRGSVRVEGRGQVLECKEGVNPTRPCDYRHFLQGETVTLTATPDPAFNPADQAVFKGWSDPRCPAQPTCSLTLLDDQTVIALFSPHSLKVDIEGRSDNNEKVTITDATGVSCTAGVDCGLFELFSTLKLVATGNLARFNPDDCDAVQQQTPNQATCVVLLLGYHVVNVGFNGKSPADTIPARIDVVVRGRKTGTGAGTIRGAMNCGTVCSVRARFRSWVTLKAEPASGSRFVRWTGGCGSNPTCSVAAVGNTVTAEFARVSALAQPSAPDAGYVARVVRVSASGRGSGRRVVIKVRVNRRSSLAATLTKNGRRAASGSWTIAAGKARTVRLRVPKAAAAGAHKLTLVLSAGGASKTFTRNVTLRR